MGKKKKLKALVGKTGNEKIEVPEAIKTLEKEIVDEAKLVCTGVVSTLYPMSQKVKELLELEKMKAAPVLNKKDAAPENRAVGSEDF